MANLIDGKKISQDIKDELKAKVEKLKSEGTVCSLAVISAWFVYLVFTLTLQV